MRDRGGRPGDQRSGPCRAGQDAARLGDETAGKGYRTLACQPPPPRLGRLVCAKGDKTSARTAYARATTALDSRKSAVEQDAWRGAHSRSTEEFLRDKALDRAWAELRGWQEQYPIDKVEGYLTLLQARYWSARNKWPQAIALAGDLVAINPDSPYADRLVFLSAECEEKSGHGDRARAAYQSLLADYPGSPLVAEARKRLGLPAPARR